MLSYKQKLYHKQVFSNIWGIIAIWATMCPHLFTLGGISGQKKAQKTPCCLSNNHCLSKYNVDCNILKSKKINRFTTMQFAIIR